jgi:hypothetical protein
MANPQRKYNMALRLGKASHNSELDIFLAEK